MPSVASLNAPPHLADWSDKALQGLRNPPRRGTFRPLDAARQQLALLSVGDQQGQARIYFLVDLPTLVISEARFLAYGALHSHAVTDAWCTLAQGKTVSEACSVGADIIEQHLQETEAPPFGTKLSDKQTSFLQELQVAAESAVPGLKILPKPVEVERYTRKREQEWNDHDKAWLPLSLMKKLMKAQKLGSDILLERTGRSIDWSVEGLHDDFQVVAKFNNISAEEVPLLIGFLSSGLQTGIHPQIEVEEAGASA